MVDLTVDCSKLTAALLLVLTVVHMYGSPLKGLCGYSLISYLVHRAHIGAWRMRATQ
jgi:hypothetical protein